VLLGAATVGSGMALLGVAAWLISAAALGPSVAELQVAIVGVRFFGIARGVLRYLERYVSHQTTFKLLAELRVWFYWTIEPLAPAGLLDYRSGDLLSRAVADIETLEQFFLRAVAPPAVALLTAVGVVAFMAGYDLRLAAVLVLFLLLGGGLAPWLMRALARAAGGRLVELRTKLNTLLVDAVQGMADLLAYGQSDRVERQVKGLGRDQAAVEGRMAWLDGLQTGLTTLFTHLGAWAVLALAIPLVSGGQIEGVVLATLALVATASFEAIGPLPAAAQYVEKSLAAARRIFEFENMAPAARDPSKPRLPSSRHDLVVDGVTFRYQPDAPPALQGVSFELREGGRTAIVGPSGAGKTTLVNLLLRFWDPQAGTITIGGVDIRQLSQSDLRRMMSVVSQQTYLFSASIRENLLIARPEASQAEVEAAADEAQVREFIESLPDSYETWVGEHGLRLSGGERQRLALARALLKDASILVLDEPTANLDAVTERQVLRAIEGLARKRTTLTITHRLVGLEGMDEIVVLAGGRAVERGRLEELLARDGYFRKMKQVQEQALAEVVE